MDSLGNRNIAADGIMLNERETLDLQSCFILVDRNAKQWSCLGARFIGIQFPLIDQNNNV